MMLCYATGLVVPVTCRLSKQLHFETRECCCRSWYLLELQNGLRFKNRQLLPIVSFMDSVTLVYQDNPVGIELFSLYVLFSQYRSCDNTLGNRFFQISSYSCTFLRIIYETTMGQVPLGPALGKTQYTRIDRFHCHATKK